MNLATSLDLLIDAIRSGRSQNRTYVSPSTRSPGLAMALTMLWAVHSARNGSAPEHAPPDREITAIVALRLVNDGMITSVCAGVSARAVRIAAGITHASARL